MIKEERKKKGWAIYILSVKCIDIILFTQKVYFFFKGNYTKK